MTKNDSSDTNGGASPRQRVVLRDIAEAVGVSVITVSRAMKDSALVSEKLRKTIQAKAAEMGYHPDPALTALAHYRSNLKEKPIQSTIAWLNFWEDRKTLRNYRVFEEYWQGALETAARSGYRLDEFFVRDYSPERLGEILKARGIRGVLLPPTDLESMEYLMRFSFNDFASVRLGWTYDVPHLHSVTSDQLANTEMAFEEISKRGYARIGFVARLRSRRVFGAGFFWAQQLSHKAKLPELLLPLDKSEGEQKALLGKWIMKHKPDAILSDEIPANVWLNDLGYRIPQDIALASTSTSIHDEYINAGVEQSSHEVGCAAVLALISQLSIMAFGVPEIPYQTLIPGKWKNGDMMPDHTK